MIMFETKQHRLWHDIRFRQMCDAITNGRQYIIFNGLDIHWLDNINDDAGLVYRTDQWYFTKIGWR